MKGRMIVRILTVVAALLAILPATGCQSPRAYFEHPTANPLGALSDPIWQAQELNAEMSDFVVYVHEFKKDTEYLNTDGEDHVKKIAERLNKGQNARVVIERSRLSPRPDTEFKYPVHTNPELDMRRREIIARSLLAMGVSDADDRVMVAPALTPGMNAYEAEAAYGAAIRSGAGGGGSGGFGGFFFGGGGGIF